MTTWSSAKYDRGVYVNLIFLQFQPDDLVIVTWVAVEHASHYAIMAHCAIACDRIVLTYATTAVR